ncbi:MAG TPA: NAD(P)-dependent oxidoreductase, partial [Verrucomicrobiae bacterium]|nr:NAD(P)-dependent oxidoreductase [Verrucomicrobiae bacterium]
AHDLGVKLVSHEEIYKNCDIITVHTPMTEETKNMIGERELAMMKQGVIIINAARGGIIEEKALLDALNGGRVAGAGVDVWSEEPPKSETVKSLIAHDRVVVTPHLGANTFEAQVNVAVDVSKEILNYLDDLPLENAVNIPRFDLALMDQMRPFLTLMNVLGDFVIQLVERNLNTVSFSYTGHIAHYDCSPLTVCGLSTLLRPLVEQDVNMVNALLVAEQMGIVVEEGKSTQAESFSNTVTITIDGADGKRTISGTLFEGQPRIVRLRDYVMDFTPEPYMLLLAYGDRPGMIGKIGTILGSHDINIASMNLGRREKRGEAMVILSIDTPVPQNVIEEVRTATDATFVKMLHLASSCSRNCGCGKV